MKKESVIDGYNLLCRIEKLENFIQTLEKASSASICIGTTLSSSAYSSYNGTREEWKYPIDENDINEIIVILNKKLEALNRELAAL